MTPAKKRGLGKGLDALLGTSQAARHKQLIDDIKTDQVRERSELTQGELRRLPVAWLKPGKYQPRKDMSQEALEELANSIRAQGVIQPIVVRPLGEQQFEIIAGERRWRACQLVRLAEVPCLVRDVPDEAAVAIALIENIQREDLNAIEEAVALQRLLEEFGLTHQALAEAVGKSRSAVSNLLRLNQLNDDVKRLVEHGDLEMGHARALLALEGELQSDLARSVVQKGLTVRETEKWVKKVQQPKSEKPQAEPDPRSLDWQQLISQRLGVGVQWQHHQAGRGKVVLSYQNADELSRLLKSLGLEE